MINWMKHIKAYFGVSLILICVSAVSLYVWGLKLGVDFKGGTLLELQFDKTLSEQTVNNDIGDTQFDLLSIQSLGSNVYIFRFSPVDQEKKSELLNTITQVTGSEFAQLRFETVGPSIGPELVRKTIYAILIAAGVILLWVAYQFKSIKYGTSAILAMFHDTFILVGAFSLLGRFAGIETDFLFVTALLTTLSFSVHDTIVVYDRIRETQKKDGGEITELANRAITETMVRSLNNSFTIMFMLIALVLLGGSTVRWFAGALMIGTLLGTYSSPFVAVPLLVTWDKLQKKKNS
jgi:preprotein translocase subunit SecF